MIKINKLILCFLVVAIAISYNGIANGQESTIWFDDLPNDLSVSRETGIALVEAARQKLAQDIPLSDNLKTTLPATEQNCMIILSISDGESEAKVFHGTGTTLFDTLQNALDKVPSNHSFDKSKLLVKLDIPTSIYSPETLTLNEAVSYEQGLDGFAFDDPYNLFFLPAEVHNRALISRMGAINTGQINDYLKTKNIVSTLTTDLAITNVTTTRFRVTSFFSNGEESFALYRGHRIGRPVTQELLLESIKMGSEYLARSVREDGTFVYQYYPDYDYVPDDYNIVRHAGSLWAMYEVYRETRDPELLEAANRGGLYLLNQMIPYGENEDQLVVLMGDEIILGSVALSLVALATYIDITGDDFYLDRARKLANYIIASQYDSGGFVYTRNYLDGSYNPYETNPFYPGESMLGLLLLNKIDPNQRYVDAAAKAADYIIYIRDAGVAEEDLPIDHWLMYALPLLYENKPEDRFLYHAVRIGGAMIRQQKSDVPFPDYLGRYYNPPFSTGMGTIEEGLSASYFLLKNNNFPNNAGRILDTILLSASPHIQTQYRQESTMYFDNPLFTNGSFKNSLKDLDTRNDYVQHSIAGLLGILRILKAENITDLSDFDSTNKINETWQNYWSNN